VPQIGLETRSRSSFTRVVSHWDLGGSQKPGFYQNLWFVAETVLETRFKGLLGLWVRVKKPGFYQNLCKATKTVSETRFLKSLLR
jgi:hypothetical protein